MTAVFVSFGILCAVLLITAGIHDARRRRKGLPVKGPDGLRGYTSGTAGGVSHTGGAGPIGDGGGGASCGDGGGGGGGC
jgi:hypothetical protein